MDALTVGIAVLANATGADFGDSLYLSADYAIPLSNDFELGLHIGSYSGDFSSDTIDIGATIAKDSWAVGVSKVDEIGTIPPLLNKPIVGFKPTIEFLLDGDKIDPEVSLPTAATEKLVATATPLPELEPPVSIIRRP